jgi:hydrogenase nickel incorporation protein HypA/HybF
MAREIEVNPTRILHANTVPDYIKSHSGRRLSKSWLPRYRTKEWLRMHELSIATSIVQLAQEEGERLGSRVIAVHLKLGPLSGVVKDALLFSYGAACKDTPLEGSVLMIEDMPLVAFCPRCQVERVIGSPQSLRCGDCGTPTPKIVGGRELQLCGLEIDDDS